MPRPASEAQYRDLRFLLWRAGFPIDPYPVTNPWIAAARSVPELEAATRRALEAHLDGSGGTRGTAPEVAFPNSDPDIVRQFLQGTFQALAEFPGTRVLKIATESYPTTANTPAARTITRTHETDSGAIVDITSDILLHPDYASSDPWLRSHGNYLNRHEALLDEGFWGQGTPTVTGAHEAVHAVAFAETHPEWMKAGVLPGFPESLDEGVAREVGAELGKPPGSVTRADLASVLSWDATTKRGELVAYAGSDAVVNGDAARGVSRYVFARLKAAVASFTPGPDATVTTWNGRAATMERRPYGAGPETTVEPEGFLSPLNAAFTSKPGTVIEELTARQFNYDVSTHREGMRYSDEPPLPGAPDDPAPEAPHAGAKRVPALLKSGVNEWPFPARESAPGDETNTGVPVMPETVHLLGATLGSAGASVAVVPNRALDKTPSASGAAPVNGRESVERFHRPGVPGPMKNWARGQAPDGFGPGF